MKKLIFILFLFGSVNIIYAQDILGGEIYIAYNDLGKFDVEARIYTDASLNVNRPNLDFIYDYAVVTRVFDTIVMPNIRYSIYKGFADATPIPITNLLFLDSIASSSFQNVVATDSFISVFIETTVADGIQHPTLSNRMPKCTDNFFDITINNGDIEYALDCNDTENKKIKYSLRDTIEGLDASEYIMPTGISINDSTGLIRWVNPPFSNPGFYLLSVDVLDVHAWSLMNRKMFIYVDSTLTDIKALEERNHLQVFPNPATNYLTVKFDYFTPKNTQIQVFDMVGRLVHQQPMEQQTEMINLSDFSSGVYVVRVQSGNETWTRKVVKQ